ncbi:stage II sporulation protein M [Bartonella sp. HY761]|uniref:stage II sporulation protein M n=1 Tax=Bartonella sp. HY761 TaxID=2979330 RepID=UPI0021FC19CE|nr:stage II sporulation protein M [Bartonella sp. HY761]UXN07137.1 stage II sporulation protein M [Bartonella sp. HY761]
MSGANYGHEFTFSSNVNRDDAIIVTEQGNLRSSRFRLEREKYWLRLDELIKRAEKNGISSFSYQETNELTDTYRQAVNSLSVARDISLDLALIEYLESLCSRAYLVVYAPQESLRGVISRLFVSGIPQAVRRSALPLFVGFLALILGAVVGFQLFNQDTSWFYSLVPSSVFDDRTPEASAEQLLKSIYSDKENFVDKLTDFAADLFSHNTQIAIFIFALGIFLAVPSFLLTFYNGLILGAFFGMHVQKGVGYDIFAWLSIHGVTELAAIAIACAGGARLGLAVLLPGLRTRKDALKHQSRDAVKLVILAAIMLIVAAFLEGFMRQTVQSAEIRLLIGWGMGGFWFTWLLLSGREKPIKGGSRR